ncbi:uncharacterized protein LOC133448536 isoform X2 [Cololabis saira]|uniref:uncharacterized protein LOC133448536 isoform X2 n=1 Tax=Cololabis saira TaxID=129043 RepID=UPI002AD37F73|nr:uncharacterized protein LOC133448536 isoform X2 [Cololabis saira]
MYFSFIMTACLLCVVLMCFLHEIKAQAGSQPKLMVDRPVITETDLVTLKCQTPASVSVTECYFKTPYKSIYSGSSCNRTLTGTELLSIEQRQSPAVITVRCYYSGTNEGITSKSADSDASTIKINNLPQPKLTVNPLEITETHSVTVNCQTPSTVPVDKCYFHFGKVKPARSFSCLTNLTGAQLLSFTDQTLPATVDVTCFYLVSHQSPESTMSTITIRFPQPELVVNPRWITESNNLTLTCVTPSSVSVAECVLYFMRTKTFRIVSCVQTLAGADLLGMVQESSPADVQLTCYYTVEQRGARYQSLHSDTCVVHIERLEEKVSTTTQIMSTSVTKDFPKGSTGVITSSLTSDDPDTGLTASSPAQTAGSLSDSPPSIPALESDRAATDASTGTSQPPVRSATPKTKHLKLLVAVFGFGVTLGVILLGGAILSPKRRGVSRNYKRSRANFNGDLTTGGNLSPGDYDSYNMITSVPDADHPAESVVNTDVFNHENADVYHMYATIAEDPCAPDQTAEPYSTVQTH